MLVSVAPEAMFDEMIAAWQALPCPDGFKVPQKKSFSPTMLRSHLQNLGIAEHVGSGRIVIRLAGTNSREFWGEEVTGAHYDAFPGGAPDSALMPPEILQALFTLPCGMKSHRGGKDHEGNDWLCDILSLPLAAQDGEVKYLLYGYRIFPSDPEQLQAWEPGFADLKTAHLLGAEFIDIGFGTPE